MWWRSSWTTRARHPTDAFGAFDASTPTGQTGLRTELGPRPLDLQADRRSPSRQALGGDPTAVPAAADEAPGGCAAVPLHVAASRPFSVPDRHAWAVLVGSRAALGAGTLGFRQVRGRRGRASRRRGPGRCRSPRLVADDRADVEARNGLCAGGASSLLQPHRGPPGSASAGFHTNRWRS